MIEALIAFVKSLCSKGFTGQVRLNFHNGKLSKKIEKKESVTLK